MLLQLLQHTPLDDNEQFRLLEQYGKRYLQECQQMPALANMLARRMVYPGFLYNTIGVICYSSS